MAKQIAPAKTTGGQGFNFEDQVAARFLLGLLGAAQPLGADLKPLNRIDWQAGDAGWRLDDLALTFGGTDHERAAGVSIKSHKQVTENGFHDSFTRACWEQWLGMNTSRQFRDDRDLLVLVTGVLADGVRIAWEKTLAEAIETVAAPERLVARLEAPGTASAGSQSSKIQRALFQSLGCPADLQASALTDEVAAARLARHVRLLHFDFESVPSRAQEEALAECRSALHAGTEEQAQALWEALVAIAARKRGRGGSIDRGELLSVLRRHFSLKDHPDFLADWNELDRHSLERLQAIKLTVGNAARLPRKRARRRLFRDLGMGRACVVVGESGVGKSAIVRDVAERRCYRLVWLTADQLHSGREVEFEAQLGLRHPFAQVLPASPTRCLVVFDGVEGFSEVGLQLVARLIAAIRSVPNRKPRIAITTQPDGVARLQVAFASASAPVASGAWKRLDIRPPNERAVERLLDKFPALGWAALRPEFRSLLRNLKVFDWVVRLHESGGLTDKPELVTLTTIIDRLWSHFVETGPDGLLRAALLKRMAATEADEMVQGRALSEFNAGELSVFSALQTAGMVRRQDERVRFAHDMLADWARLRLLVQQRLTESDPAIRRAASAGWYRSVRLYAQRILELPDEGLEHWHWAVQALGSGNPERVIIRDLFLEALVLAQNARTLFSAAWPALVAGDGELLRLLLDRFFYVGTVADWRVLSGIEDQAEAAQLAPFIRVPFTPFWSGVLPVLAEHANDVVRCALAPTAKLLRLWLSMVSPRQRATSRLRHAAARLTLTVAREVQAREAEGQMSVEKEVRTDVYIALLWAAPEHPDEVAQLCLELANRRAEAEPVRLRREAAREKERRATQALRENNPEAAALTGPLVTPEQIFGPKLAPWPDGPNHRVDEAFQKACLDHQAIFALVVNRPREALETLLAVLIQHPMRQGVTDWSVRDSLGLDDNLHCHPPFYHQGPFWLLLKSSQETAEFALTLIIRLVNFATERWQENHRRLIAKYPDYAKEGPSCVTVPTSDGWKEFPGDRNVLRWHDGWAPQPAVLSSMLMALEKWLYDEADAGRHFDRRVGRILSEGKSAAFVGVLVLLAKYKAELLIGPFRPLAGAWEIYAMEPRLKLERSSMAFWSMAWMRYGETAWNRARDWHVMPHRNTMLLNHVIPLVIENEEFRNAVVGFHQEWGRRLEADPANTHLRDPVQCFDLVTRYGRIAAEGKESAQEFQAWFQSIKGQAVAAQHNVNEELLPLTFAPHCRKLLDEDQPLSPDEMDPFWGTVQSLASQPKRITEAGTQTVDAAFGGIAVLLLLHRDWLREYPARENWCLDQLEAALLDPPGSKPFDIPESVGCWDWDTFVPECGVALLAENRTDPFARKLVVEGLISFRHATVAATMRRAYRLRAKLGGEFERMVAFVSEWSAYRWSLFWSDQWGLNTDRFWKSECAPRLNGFVRAVDLPPRPDLAEIHTAGRQLTESHFAAYRKQWERSKEGWLQKIARWTGFQLLSKQIRNRLSPRHAETNADLEEDDGFIEADNDPPTLRRGIPPTWPGLDLGYLSNGFAWLENAITEQSVPDIAVWALRGLLEVSLSTVPPSDRKKRRQSTRFPTKFDQWLYERIAGALLRLEKQGKADDLWRPIFALGVTRKYWVKFFLSDWFRTASSQDVQPEEFVAIWKRIVQYALDEPDWDAVSDADEVVSELLGFEMGNAVLGGDERYAWLIAEMSPLFENAALRWFVRGKVAARFCRFALKPAGAELLLPGIGWLRAVEPMWTEWSWGHEGLAEGLADALRAALDRHRGAIAANAESREAFFHLCNQLVARGHHAALALRERVIAGCP